MKKKIIRNIKIFNSISGKKELFIPINPGYVGIYVCGPTVYDYIHLGNCRTFIFFDIVFRYLKHIGYKVRYVRNITDIGHLEDDIECNDKILKQAIIEKISPMEVAQKYILDFHEIMNIFNTLPPSIEPIATGHIIEQIELIKNIINKKLAYESNGSVYFNIKNYNMIYDYSLLNNRKLNSNLESRSLNKKEDKQNIQDFALWKKASLTHIMNWPSPWGIGFPGWHIECVAMSIKYLGYNFDIHGGGIDLKFPHHECELAQGYAAHDNLLANYWMHSNMMIFNNKKMSKSTGNKILPRNIFYEKNDFFEKSFHPIIVKFCILQSHYRSILSLSKKRLFLAEKKYYDLINAIEILDTINPEEYSNFNINLWCNKCYDAMDDDFNTPLLISHLFEGVKIIKRLNIKKTKLSKIDIDILKKTINNFFFNILGLDIIKYHEIQSNKNFSDSLIKLIIKLRQIARYEKNWKLSDDIRLELNKLGIEIEDNNKKTIFRIKK